MALFDSSSSPWGDWMKGGSFRQLGSADFGITPTTFSDDTTSFGQKAFGSGSGSSGRGGFDWAGLGRFAGAFAQGYMGSRGYGNNPFGGGPQWGGGGSGNTQQLTSNLSIWDPNAGKNPYLGSYTTPGSKGIGGAISGALATAAPIIGGPFGIAAGLAGGALSSMG